MPSGIGSRKRRENSRRFDGRGCMKNEETWSRVSRNHRSLSIGPTRNAARAWDQSVPHAKPVKPTHKTRLRPATVSRQSSRYGLYQRSCNQPQKIKRRSGIQHRRGLWPLNPHLQILQTARVVSQLVAARCEWDPAVSVSSCPAESYRRGSHAGI